MKGKIGRICLKNKLIYIVWCVFIYNNFKIGKIKLLFGKVYIGGKIMKKSKKIIILEVGCWLCLVRRMEVAIEEEYGGFWNVNNVLFFN